MVSQEEVHLASQSSSLGSFVVAADLMRGDITPLQPSDRLDRAVELFVENDVDMLPVVASAPGGVVLGLVRRSDVSNRYLQQVHGTTRA
jgi:predicted transcriptional regulator